jgi:hypothetical protein
LEEVAFLAKNARQVPRRKLSQPLVPSPQAVYHSNEIDKNGENDEMDVSQNRFYVPIIEGLYFSKDWRANPCAVLFDKRRWASL